MAKSGKRPVFKSIGTDMLQVVLEHPINVFLSLLSNAILLLDLFYFFQIIQRVRGGDFSSEIFFQSGVVLGFFLIFSFLSTQTTPNIETFVKAISSVIGLILSLMLVSAFWAMCYVLVVYGFDLFIEEQKATYVINLNSRILIASYMFFACFAFCEIYFYRASRFANLISLVPVAFIFALVLWRSMEGTTAQEFFAKELRIVDFFAIASFSVGLMVLVVFAVGRLRFASQTSGQP